MLFDADERPVSVSSTVALSAKDALVVKAYNAHLSLLSVSAPRVGISVGQGFAQFRLDGELDRYTLAGKSKVEVSSVTAPIFVTSKHILSVDMERNALRRAMFRSDGAFVQVTPIDRDAQWWKAHMAPRSREALTPLPSHRHGIDSVYLVFYSVHSAFYAIARDEATDLQKTDLQTWIGVEQAKPSLPDSAKNRLKALEEWVSSDPAANWLADLHVTGEDIPKGNWRFVSAASFLFLDYWFLLTSAGFMTPRTLTVDIHMMGLFCRKDDMAQEHHLTFGDDEKTTKQLLDIAATDSDSVLMENVDEWDGLGADIGLSGIGSRCQGLIMSREFRAFWMAFETIHAPSIYPVWKRADGGGTYFFDVKRDAVVVEAVTRNKYAKAFTVCVIVNFLVAACTGAFVAQWAMKNLDEALLQGIVNQSTAANAGSHRLDFELEQAARTSWHISVTLVYKYNMTYLSIVWIPRKDGALSYTVQICPVSISAEAEPQALHSREEMTDPHEVHFTVSAAEAVKSIETLAGEQERLLVPVRYPVRQDETCPWRVPQSWELSGDLRYRLRLRSSLDESGQAGETSNWSSEFAIGAQFTAADIPTLAARRFLQPDVNSLSLFLLKHCLVYAPFQWTLRFSHPVVVFTSARSSDEQLGEMGQNRGGRLEGGGSADERFCLICNVHFGADSVVNRKVSSVSGVAAWSSISLKPDETLSSDSAAVFVAEDETKKDLTVSTALLTNLSTAFSVEILSGEGGRSLASGSVPLEGIQLAVTHHLASFYSDETHSISDQIDLDLTIKIALTSPHTRAQIGKLELTLDPSFLQPYIRHTFPSDAISDRMQRPHFIRDVAGAACHLGRDFLLRWRWPPHLRKPDMIYLHIFDDRAEEYIAAINDGRPIQNTGSFVWTVQVDMPPRQIRRQIRILLSLKPHQPGTELEIIAQSHAFLALRTTTLTEFEFTYAAFCRSNNLLMHQASDRALAAHGLAVVKRALRLCLGVREKLPFENTRHTVLAHGQSCVSPKALITRVVGPTFSSASLAAMKGGVSVIKSTHMVVDVIEGLVLIQDNFLWEGSLDSISLYNNLLLFLPCTRAGRNLSKFIQSLKSQDVAGEGRHDAIYLLPRTVEHHQATSFYQFQVNAIFHQAIQNSLKFILADWFDISLFACVIYVNYTTLVFGNINRSTAVDARFFSDLVFSEHPLRFLLDLPLLLQLLLVSAMLGSILSGIADVASEYLCNVESFFWQDVVIYGVYVSRWAEICAVFTCVTAVSMWFLATALCWSDTYFPALVIIGACGFIVYSVSKSYDTAQQLVMSFVTENLKHLLSLALENWFESSDVDLKQQEAKLMQLIDSETGDTRILDSLKAWRKRSRNYSGVDKLAFFKSANKVNVAMEGTHRGKGGQYIVPLERPIYGMAAANWDETTFSVNKLKQRRFFADKAVGWYLHIWAPPPTKPFVISRRSGRLRGGDMDNLPIAGRLARPDEVAADESFCHVAQTEAETDSLLLERATLTFLPDGQTSIERQIPLGRTFTEAVVCLPLFPPAHELPYNSKLIMIFRYFDEAQTGRWNETEFRAWLSALRKPGLRLTWQNIQRRFKFEYKMKIHPVLGCDMPELGKYYRMDKTLDSDYDTIFPSQNPHLRFEKAMSAPPSRAESSLQSVSRSVGTDSASVGGTASVDSDASESSAEEGSDEESFVSKRLREDANARKLLVIYTRCTERHRDQRVDALIKRSSTLAARVLEIQYRILSPSFGANIIFRSEQKALKLVRVQRGRRNSVDQLSRTAMRHMSLMTRMDALTHRPSDASTTRHMTEGMLTHRTRLRGPSYTSLRQREISPSPTRPAVRFANYSEATSSQALKISTTKLAAPPRLLKLDPQSRMPPAFVSMMIGGQVAFQQALTHSFQRLTKELYDPAYISMKISDFYDRVIQSRVQTVAMALLQPHVEMTPPQLTETSYNLMMTHPRPLTANQALTRLTKYRVEHSEELKLLFDKHHNNDEIPVDLMAKLLVEIEVLTADDVVGFTSDEDPRGRIKAFEPRTGSLRAFLRSQLHLDVPSSATLDNVFDCIAEILSTYLWRDAFRLLCKLMGLRLETERLETARTNHGILAANLEVVEGVFESLAAGRTFLHHSLADEVILLITDNKIGFSALCACLEFLSLDVTDHFGGTRYVVDALREISDSENMEQEGTLKASHWSDKEAELELDWSGYWACLELAPNLVELFHKVSAAGSAFLSKSQTVQLVTMHRDAHLNEEVGRVIAMNMRIPDGLRQTPVIKMGTFEMFNSVMMELHVVANRRHSKMWWALLCGEIAGDKILSRLPIHSIVEAFLTCSLQPVLHDGSSADWTHSIKMADWYSGVMTFSMFLHVLSDTRVSLPRSAARRMWASFERKPLVLSGYLPAVVRSSSIVISFNQSDLPPMHQPVAVATVFRELPRLLMTGLWPEAIQAFIACNLNQDPPTVDELKEVMARVSKPTHPYGMIEHGKLPRILTALDVKGMSFNMLNEVVTAMRLGIPPTLIRVMFSTMDANHDKTLDLIELLTGFEILFSNLIPELIIRNVGISSDHKLQAIAVSLVGLLVFFLFIGLAYRSFTTAGADATGTAMQSLLAVGGAITLQTSAQQDERVVMGSLIEKMEAILGEGLQKRLQQTK